MAELTSKAAYDLFDYGIDTFDIAKGFGISEHEVDRLLTIGREDARALPRSILTTSLSTRIMEIDALGRKIQ